MTHAATALAVVVLLVSCQRAGNTGKKAQATTSAPPATAATAAKAVEPPTRPDPAPLTAAAWVNTGPLTLEALKGKVVVLDFWAIYCGPCRTLIPRLNQLYLKHKDQGLVAIGVTEDRKAEVEKFAPQHQLTYPVAIDKLTDGDGTTFTAWRIVAVPAACVIGRDGKVAWRGPGDKLTEDILLNELARK